MQQTNASPASVRAGGRFCTKCGRALRPGADTGNYTSAYNSFLSRIGWLYSIPNSMDLRKS